MEREKMKTIIDEKTTKEIYHSIKGFYKGKEKVLTLGLLYEVTRPLTQQNLVQVFLNSVRSGKFKLGDIRDWKFNYGDIRSTDETREQTDMIQIINIQCSIDDSGLVLEFKERDL